MIYMYTEAGTSRKSIISEQDLSYHIMNLTPYKMNSDGFQGVKGQRLPLQASQGGVESLRIRCITDCNSTALSFPTTGRSKSQDSQ